MNQLSWLLYLGNVAGHLGLLFLIFGLAVTLLSVILWVAFIDEDGPLEKPRWAAFFSILTFILLLFAAFCPSQTTVYAIAASEIGEKALQTPLAGKAGQALESWLDKQIANNEK